MVLFAFKVLAQSWKVCRLKVLPARAITEITRCPALFITRPILQSPDASYCSVLVQQ